MIVDVFSQTDGNHMLAMPPRDDGKIKSKLNQNSLWFFEGLLLTGFWAPIHIFLWLMIYPVGVVSGHLQEGL